MNQKHPGWKGISIKTLFVWFSIFFSIDTRAQNVGFPENGFSWGIRISRHDFDRHSILTNEQTAKISQNQQTIVDGNCIWKVDFNSVPVASNKLPGTTFAQDVRMKFTLQKGNSSQTRLTLELEDQKWTKDHYLMLPAAAYNGNRFDYRRIAYSPKLLDPRDIGPEKATIISDVPKLNFGEGPSKIEERSGGMTTPSINYFSSARKQSVMMLFGQGNSLGDYGVQVEESRNRDKVWIRLTSPVVREGYKYRITDNRYPSPDKARDFKEGDTCSISCRLYILPTESIHAFYDAFSMVRKDMGDHQQAPSALTFGQCFNVQEHKFNTQNFVAAHGYYSVGMRENFLQDWQIGWTGGMISTYPLLVLGADSTRKNVARNFDWVFRDGISPSGFFWDSGEKGTQWYGGDIRKPHTKNWHLVRKSGDGLFFVLKQFEAMRAMSVEVKPVWKEKTRGVADAFLRLWQENKQLGQFIDNVTGKIQVGGSASGAIVPAALVLAAGYYGEPRYLEAAKAIGSYFEKEHLDKGLINGGPGDALQNPDSESSYALIESYVALFEATKDPHWLDCGRKALRQFSTWVSSYNYRFPPQSLFGKIGIRSLGAVNANTQNRHGAPAICTHSGLGLLKLYMATGDTLAMDLLQDIAHQLPQYMGTSFRPIPGVKEGWVCERVSTTDWFEGIGEITYQSTWAETGLMLTRLEIPGLVVEESGKIWVFDQVEARLVSRKGNKTTIEIYNPTNQKTNVRYQFIRKGMVLPEGKFQVEALSVNLGPQEKKKVVLVLN